MCKKISCVILCVTLLLLLSCEFCKCPSGVEKVPVGVVVEKNIEIRNHYNTTTHIITPYRTYKITVGDKVINTNKKNFDTLQVGDTLFKKVYIKKHTEECLKLNQKN